jgi:phenylacetate-CoA ligase
MKLTKLLLRIKWKKFDKIYNFLLNNQFKSFDIIQSDQLNDLKKIVLHTNSYVPYYKYLPVNYDLLKSENIEAILKLFPLVNKKTIKSNIELFKSDSKKINDKIYELTTGGSTGVPLRYKLNKNDLMYSRLLKYRGFSYSGYKIGDPIILIGGGSLVNKPTFKNKIIDFLLNAYKFSSYKINENILEEIIQVIKRKNKIYIYGYASSIYLISKYVIDKNYTFVKNNVMGVFPTSEVLHDFQRSNMELAFGDCIYNDYGVNDGGVSAHECEMHNGMHIDPERSIIEVINDNGENVYEGIGRVVATSLKNYAMPFIRYETGDIVKITHQPCECGRSTPRIIEIFGRTTDFITIDNNYIGSPVLTVLMGKLDIDLYQIIQEDVSNIIFNVYKTTGFDEEQRNIIEVHIKNSIFSHYKNVSIKIKYYDEVPNIDNKFKYIINKTRTGDKIE